LFSILITDNFIGEEVTLDENSVCGYKMMGFNTLSEDEESNIFSLRLELPIPFFVFWRLIFLGKIWSSHPTIKFVTFK
jgi:hypothetical protein